MSNLESIIGDLGEITEGTLLGTLTLYVLKLNGAVVVSMNTSFCSDGTKRTLEIGLELNEDGTEGTIQ